MKTKVVIGGGLTGLFAADLLSKKHKVILIEKNDRLGGLFYSFDYGKHGHFDIGMHNLYETGNEIVDSFLSKMYSCSESSIFSHNKRDLAGNYFNGELNYGTVYPRIKLNNSIDLVNEKYISEPVFSGEISVGEYLSQKFSEEVVVQLLEVIEGVYKVSNGEISSLAAKMIPLTRVSYFSHEEMMSLVHIDIIKNNICFPDQRLLPESLITTKKMFYPKKMGCNQFIDCLVNLIKDKIEIKKRTSILDYKLVNNCITSIKLDDGSVLNDVDIFWAGGVFSFNHFLGSKVKFKDRPHDTVIISLKLKEKIKDLRDLHYIFNYDKSSFIYRVSAFYNYSESWDGEGFPVGVELTVPQDFKINDYISYTITALNKMGFLNNNEIIFIKSEVLKNGFPLPTLSMMEGVRSIQTDILESNFKNIIVGGVFSSECQFFQGENLVDCYVKLNQKGWI